MKRFKSKVDMWLLVVLIAAMVLQAYVLFDMLFTDRPASARYLMIAGTLLLYSLVASILLRTHYTVTSDVLHIVCGPISRTVKLKDITAVRETRNPLSSPALSLDRLKISYGRRSIMISPDDKKGFLKAIGRELS